MISYYKMLNIIPCAIIQWVLIAYLFYYIVVCFLLNLKCLIYPPPPHLSPSLTISLFSIKHLLYAVPCAALTLLVYRLKTS